MNAVKLLNLTVLEPFVNDMTILTVACAAGGISCASAFVQHRSQGLSSNRPLR